MTYIDYLFLSRKHGLLGQTCTTRVTPPNASRNAVPHPYLDGGNTIQMVCFHHPNVLHIKTSMRMQIIIKFSKARTLPLGPKSLKVKHQAFPHDGSTGLRWPTPSSPPVTDNHHGAGAKGATGCGRKIREFLGWHRCYLLCPDLLFQSLLLKIL